MALTMMAAQVVGAGAARAQEPEPALDNFASVATFTVSVPFGDAHRFTSTPSWLGISWEGQWTVRRSLVAGALLGMHDFYERSDGTMEFPSGAATGEQARELTMATMLATTRWFPGGTRWRGVVLGLGAGTIWARESFQLGVFDPILNSAFHLAVVPEAAVTIPIFEGVKGMVGARYSLTAPAGSYLGGGKRSFHFLTLTFSVIEH
jgi:hypothetical protein